ncbi:hypothetical protein BC834DRAFT_970220 [Gloeopeniophorella convolvens]|nr:hypothetical protein BC834DRAFT_970220 [Gloeopeniophorella convolvens]
MLSIPFLGADLGATSARSDAVVHTLFLLQVKTRMQLERGKSSVGLLGSFRSILWATVSRPGAPLLLEAPKRATECMMLIVAPPGASTNDFWGKTFKTLFGEAEMTLRDVRWSARRRAADRAQGWGLKPVFRNGGHVLAAPMVERRYFGTIFQVKQAAVRAKCHVLPKAKAVKSRIQGMEKVPDIVPMYNWIYPGITTISREEGPAALYEGFIRRCSSSRLAAVYCYSWSTLSPPYI